MMKFTSLMLMALGASATPINQNTVSSGVAQLTDQELQLILDANPGLSAHDAQMIYHNLNLIPDSISAQDVIDFFKYLPSGATYQSVLHAYEDYTGNMMSDLDYWMELIDEVVPAGLNWDDAKFLADHAHLIPAGIDAQDILNFILANKEMIPEYVTEAHKKALYDYVVATFFPQDDFSDQVVQNTPSGLDWGDYHLAAQHAHLIPGSVTYRDILQFTMDHLDQIPSHVSAAHKQEAYKHVYDSYFGGRADQTRADEVLAMAGEAEMGNLVNSMVNNAEVIAKYIPGDLNMSIVLVPVEQPDGSTLWTYQADLTGLIAALSSYSNDVCMENVSLPDGNKIANYFMC